MNIVLYIAMSLDGYIAGENGDLHWLSKVERDGEDYGYQAFYEGVDALIMGSNSYEKILELGGWPYPDKPCYVMSGRSLPLACDNVQLLAPDTTKALEELRAAGFQRVWLVGGGGLLRSFQGCRAVNEYIISVIPVLLGKGIRLFLSNDVTQSLCLIAAREYPGGLVQCHYTATS